MAKKLVVLFLTPKKKFLNIHLQKLSPWQHETAIMSYQFESEEKEEKSFFLVPQIKNLYRQIRQYRLNQRFCWKQTQSRVIQ